MKTKSYIIIALMLAGSLMLKAQDNKFYTTSGGEMIFSFATIEDAGSETGNIIRWSPVFNLQNLANFEALLSTPYGGNKNEIMTPNGLNKSEIMTPYGGNKPSELSINFTKLKSICQKMGLKAIPPD